MIAPIVLTGGPCAGKTTALPYLTERLLDIGYYPILIREAPTALMDSRISPRDAVFSDTAFQQLIIERVLIEERFAHRALAAASHPRPLIVSDRGIMDALAYMNADAFWSALRLHDLDAVRARDVRYSSVYHLRTAALGAEEHYTLATNPHRRETPAEARARDAQTLEAWIGHPHLRVIANDGAFDEKLRRLFAAVCQQLGVPVPIERERKFLLTEVPDIATLGPCQHIDIEQFYVWTPDPSIEKRYRKRGQYGSYMYVETIKRPHAHGERVETEQLSSAEVYATAKNFMAPGTDVIEKMRICFVYNNQYCELDIFGGRHRGRVYLEIELTEQQDRIVLPPQFRGIREVTGDERHGNRALANL